MGITYPNTYTTGNVADPIARGSFLAFTEQEQPGHDVSTINGTPVDFPYINSSPFTKRLIGIASVAIRGINKERLMEKLD